MKNKQIADLNVRPNHQESAKSVNEESECHGQMSGKISTKTGSAISNYRGNLYWRSGRQFYVAKSRVRFPHHGSRISTGMKSTKALVRLD